MFPRRLTFHNSMYLFDGGTTSLRATDEFDREHGVTLVQHAFARISPSLDLIPGRLYFDGSLVPMRSESEFEVLRLLGAAEIRYIEPPPYEGEQIQLSPNALMLSDEIRQTLARTPEENMRAQLASIISFVESDDYVRFAEKVEQAADPTLYSVWVVWESTIRNQVLVRLGRVLGIGLPAARELLDRSTPLAEEATALEVSALVDRYSAEGLNLRTEPEFRWRRA